jgi:two-component system cell cycle sensor histidine kinase/response regulator CckA
VGSCGTITVRSAGETGGAVLSMNTSNVADFPHEEETQRLRARIAELEEEITDMRGSVETDHPSELQYKDIFDNISVCMFLIDVTSDGRFKYAGFNPAEELAVGLTSAEVSGKFVEEVFSEELAKKLTATYRRCLEAGTPIKYDDELDLPSGQRYFHSNLIPMRNGSGRIHQIVGACIDITDFRRTQDQALARQKLESLGVLAGGIAHDFNNLLGGILAQAELAETELAVGSPPGQELQAIKTVAIRAGEMVRELMVYSGQDEARLEPLDLSRLVEEMLELVKISISKHATLIVDLPKNLPAVRANAVQMRQIVMNLITNASEALGDKEGVISVIIAKVESEQDALAECQSDASAGGRLRLEVRDTGGGMTAETVAKIFDPFFTTKVSGRGLGLAAVQGIVRSHGGAISVVSVPGQGSCFEILLPCIGQPASDTPDIAIAASAHESGSVAGTVLVVEDEEILRLAISKMLRRERFSVIEAGDGTSGADLFRVNEPRIDVVLLDVTLPGMSGRDVLKEMRRIRPDVKVVLTTAFNKDNALSSIDEQHPWGYVRKPYQFRELISLLRKACQDKPEMSGNAGA